MLRWSVVIGVTLATAIGCERATTATPAAVASWVVDPSPQLVLGAVRDDTTQMFAVVVGATRLPGGDILVADRLDQTLTVFGPDGSRKRSAGRKGSGPGEFGYPASLWRCGDSVFVYDIDGYRTSVWSLDVAYVRSFRFNGSAEVGGITPYQSACNRDGTFAHYGWEDMRQISPDQRVYRVRVPFWIGGADSGLRAVIDSFPGSERVLSLDRASGRVTGSAPRMFGMQTSIAVGAQRIYIGSAERPELLAVRLSTLQVDTIVLPWQSAPLTPEDIAAEKAVQIAASPPASRSRIEQRFADHPFPETLPPYDALVVDAEDLLWVRDYPRASSPTVRWTVVSGDGAVIALADVPAHLDVFEIGTDYVLGRYVDPVEAIPEVRLYGLRRQ